MINKQNIFASAGQQTQGYSTTDYVTGMIPDTIAMAEDVNSFGNKVDSDLYTVCQEIANVITNGVLDKDGGDGAPLNSADNTQLLTTLRAMPNGFSQTGIMYNGVDAITCPEQDGVTSIKFGGAMHIMFNEGGYFGNSASKMHIGTIAENTTWEVTNSVPVGVIYLYAYFSGGSVTIQYQQSVITGEEGSNKCLLGSAFIINNNGTKQIQENSWKFQPWLQNTPAIDRESPTAQTKGGLITANTGTQLNIGTLEIKAEGINFDSGSHQNPNIKKLDSGSFTYKFLYPGYDPSVSASTTLDTTHLYNLTNATWDDISAQAGKYMVLVPCVAPTGQTLLIPAMSYYNSSTGGYTNIFDTIEDATTAIYGLPYTSTSTDKTRERAIYLGYSMVVKIGATDLTDSRNYVTVGMIPQALDGFSYAGGQTGGGTGTYNPMPVYTWNTNSLTAKTNYKNIITGRTATVVVTLPAQVLSVVNTIEIEYTHSSNYGGINIIDGTTNQPVVWWDQVDLNFVNGQTYLITCEWVNGKWRAKKEGETLTMLKTLYPVGSIYIGTQSTCPLSTLIPGSSWSLVATNRALWGGNGSNGTATIDAGLPNITGNFAVNSPSSASTSGAFALSSSWNSHGWDGTTNGGRTYDFDASRSSSIYGNSSTVQPPAYVVNVWRRTA